MLTRILATIGGATLAILALLGFLFVVGSSLPDQPQPIRPALTERDLKLQDETGQLRTIARPETGPFATTKITTPPPVPLPVTTVPAAPSPIPPRPLDGLQAPAQAQVTSGPLNETPEAIQPASGARQGRGPRCTRNRTYDPETQSYRGYDGLMHPCRL
jgi:hypothetical protein